MANHNKGIVADAKCLTKKLLKKKRARKSTEPARNARNLVCISISAKTREKNHVFPCPKLRLFRLAELAGQLNGYW
jgi:hypothetical protein